MIKESENGNIDGSSKFDINKEKPKSQDKTKRNVNSGGNAKPKDRTENLLKIKTDGKGDINRSGINLDSRGTGGKTDINRKELDLQNKRFTEGRESIDRSKINEGVRGVDGHEPKKVKDLSNVLDGEPEAEQKEIKTENLYKGYKKFIRKTDSLTNVYLKK